MLIFDDKYLNFYDTLNCGQVFRFYPDSLGFVVISLDKLAKVYNQQGKAYIETDDEKYFKRYFDIDKDYSTILQSIVNSGDQKVISVSQRYSGVRILVQDTYEALFSFIISQNNNIPRIKSTIEKLCKMLGKPVEFLGKTYYSFPLIEDFANASNELLQSAGLGYRAEYLSQLSKDMLDKKVDLTALKSLPTNELKAELLKIKGVGDKVANCATLFGFNRSDSFPVDTWMEKIYREDFNGTLTDRKKISQYFLDIYKENSGYVQQYLFYAKREKFI